MMRMYRCKETDHALWSLRARVFEKVPNRHRDRLQRGEWKRRRKLMPISGIRTHREIEWVFEFCLALGEDIMLSSARQ